MVRLPAVLYVLTVSKAHAVSRAIVLSTTICFASFALATDKEPSAVELAMWEYAVSTGKMEEVDRFLELYPGSIFTDAAVKLKATIANSAASAEPKPANGQDGNSGSDTSPANNPVEQITFDQPLSSDPLEKKRSLQQLANGSPLFPPLPELPAEVWEGKNCSNCHAWKKDNLCDQANFLASKDQEAMDRIKHPYGGFFRDALKQWAAGGCQ